MKLRNTVMTVLTAGFTLAGVAVGGGAAFADVSVAPVQVVSLGSIHFDRPALQAGGYQFQVTSTTGDSVTMAYQLGSDLSLKQHGHTVELRSKQLKERSTFPETLTSASGRPVAGHWTIGAGNTLTFTIDHVSTMVAHG